MRPFSTEETAEYVASRLARSGLTDQAIFSPDILRRIHASTHGIPRLINSVCDNLLLTAFAMESRVATTQMFEEVARDLRLSPGVSRSGNVPDGRTESLANGR